MATRRPAEGPPTGSPDPKKARTDAAPAPSAASLSIEAIKAQMAARKAAMGQGTNPAAALPPGAVRVAPIMGTGAVSDDVAARLAAAKARIEAMNNAQASASAPSARPSNPYLSRGGAAAASSSATPAPAAGPSSAAPSASAASAGLHPLLAGESVAQQKEEEKNEKRKERDRYKTMAPKFSTVRANQAVVQASAAQSRPAAAAPVLNPYAAGGVGASGSASPAPDEERVVERKSRKMHFSAAGKYVKQGDVLRAEAKMEALRQRIADASRKAGLDSEFDVLERSLRVSHDALVRAL